MIADTTWEFRESLEPRMLSDISVASFDEDFLNAALLFLDQEDAVVDSDSLDTLPVDSESSVMIDSGSGSDEASSSQQLNGSRSPFASSPETRPTAPRRVNKRREEIHALRSQAENLQTRLRMLKAAPLVSPSTAPGPFMIAPLGSTWEDVASRQFEQRERAEKENKRLKALMIEHKRIATALQQVATQSMAFQANKLLQPPSPQPQPPTDSSFSLQVPNILEVLAGSLDLMVDQTDLVISDTLGRTLETERHGNSHLSVHIQDARIVPVGVSRTVSIMWEHALLEEDLKQLQWTVLSEDTFHSEFVTYAEFPGFRGHALGKMVLRRVEQADRIVIVRSAVFQCRCPHLKDQFSSLPMRHFLWTVIDRPPHLGMIPGQDTISRVRTSAISLPRIDVGDLDDPTRDRAIDELLQLNIAISTQQCDKAIETVDKKLLGLGSHTRREGWQSQSDLPVRMVSNAC